MSFEDYYDNNNNGNGNNYYNCEEYNNCDFYLNNNNNNLNGTNYTSSTESSDLASRNGTSPLTLPTFLFMSITSSILGLMILATIIGNVFVIAAVLKEKNLQSVANYLIVSLAVADLMVACLVMPMGALYSITGNNWIMGPVLCDVWTSSDVLCCTASILHLVAIAVDRYWAVTDIEYIRSRNKSRINTMILLVWAVALVVSIAPILGWKDPDFYTRVEIERKCLISQDVGYQIFATCATFYVPLIVILLLYWKIFQTARARIRHRPGGRARTTDKSKTNSMVITEEISSTRIGGGGADGCGGSDEVEKSCMDPTPGPSSSAHEDEGNTMVNSPNKNINNNAIDVKPIVNQGQKGQGQGQGVELGSPNTEDEDDQSETQGGGGKKSETIESLLEASTVVTTPEAYGEDEDDDIDEDDDDVELNDNGESHVLSTIISTLPPPPPNNNTKPNHHCLSSSPIINVIEPPPQFSNNSNPTMATNNDNICNNDKMLNTTTTNGDNNKEIVLETLSPSTLLLKSNTSSPSKITTTTTPSLPSLLKSKKSSKESIEAKRERKAAKTLAIITGAFVVCWLPFFVMALLMALCESCWLPEEVASAFLWLGYFNSTLNPIIYNVFSPEFRLAFKRILFGRNYGRRRRK